MLSGSIGLKKITPKQLVRQWQRLPNKLDVNIWNFEIKAGKEAVSVFKQSFTLLRFNSSGEFPWRARKDKKTHAILNETGSLKESISWTHIGGKKGASGKTGARIYTDPNKFKNTKRHRGFCFAAVHNAKDGTYSYGRTGVRSIQRQYIGHSTVLKDRLIELADIIFEGFPK